MNKTLAEDVTEQSLPGPRICMLDAWACNEDTLSMNLWIPAILALASSPLWVKGIFTLYDGVYDRAEAWQLDRIKRRTVAALAAAKVAHAQVRPVYAQDGRMPLLLRADGAVRDANTLRAYTIDVVREQWPALERLDALVRMGLPSGGGKVLEALDAQQPWPNVPPLMDVLRERPASIHSLILGQRRDGGLIIKSLHQMMHTLIVGATDQGKTSLLRSIVAQLALAPEPCEVVAVDVHGAGFNVLSDWSKLQYPVARTRKEAIALFRQLGDELNTRRRLYQRFPVADNLMAYCREAQAHDAQPLAPKVFLVDEGTILLNEKGVADPLRVLVQGGRQYGLYGIVTGQSVKHSVMDTQTRDQFLTRYAMRASPTSMRVVLGDKPPGELPAVKGRAWAQFNGGVDTEEVQSLYVSQEDFYPLVRGDGPRLSMPEDGKTARARRIHELDAEGLSQRKIEEAVFGYGGGHAHKVVGEVLDEA